MFLEFKIKESTTILKPYGTFFVHISTGSCGKHDTKDTWLKSLLAKLSEINLTRPLIFGLIALQHHYFHQCSRMEGNPPYTLIHKYLIFNSSPRRITAKTNQKFDVTKYMIYVRTLSAILILLDLTNIPKQHFIDKTQKKFSEGCFSIDEILIFLATQRKFRFNPEC